MVDFFKVYLVVIAVAATGTVAWKSFAITGSFLLSATLIYANVWLLAKLAERQIDGGGRGVLRFVLLLLAKYVGVFLALGACLMFLPLHVFAFICGSFSLLAAVFLFALRVAWREIFP